MKKKTLSYHKPNRDMTKGSALQVTRAEGGIYIQLAKQKGPMSNNGTQFNWTGDSFSTKLKTEELMQILNMVKKAEQQLNDLQLIQKLTNNNINFEDVKDCRFPHLNSQTPKTIFVGINLYNGNLTMKITINGTMQDQDRNKKENQTINIYLNEAEYRGFLAVIEYEAGNYLENNLIASIVASTDGQYNTKMDLPNLNIGETIKLPNGADLIIRSKTYDIKQQKTVYHCAPVNGRV